MLLRLAENLVLPFVTTIAIVHYVTTPWGVPLDRWPECWHIAFPIGTFFFTKNLVYVHPLAPALWDLVDFLGWC